MQSDCFFQDDERFRDLLWYDKNFTKLIDKLTRALHSFGDGGDGERLLAAAQELLTQTELLVREPYKQSARYPGSIAKSGCWHVCVANMVRLFNVPLGGKACNPQILVLTLRKARLGTLTNYVRHPFVDPLAFITKGRVQMSQYRDYGKAGATAKEAKVEALLGLTNGTDCCAVVNVQGHEFIPGGDSHYVLVKRMAGDDYKIIDPGWPDIERLSEAYPVVYQVSIYRKM
jgi:hypothetical protein